MSRQMTPQEKAQFHSWFPSLNVNAAVVTGEGTRAYNCISWTVGVTNVWLWPGATLQQFDAFYAHYGLRRSGAGPVAAWGLSASNMTHGCVSGPGHGPRWESKCGQSLRIEHGLNELVSSGYGHVIAFYAHSRAATKAEADLTDSLAKGQSLMTLDDDQKKTLQVLTNLVDPELKDTFEKAFEAWKSTWSSPAVQFRSDPAALIYSNQYLALIAMGQQIVPLVVDKLADDDNFFALQLYDALQSSSHMIVSLEPGTEDFYEGEQGRAKRTVARFLSAM